LSCGQFCVINFVLIPQKIIVEFPYSPSLPKGERGSSEFCDFWPGMKL
jgi:hypothetical protein